VAGRRRESFAERRERRAEVDDPEVVLNAAARFLEARARSVGEVRRRLTQAGYRSDLVEGVIDRLAALGMLDDDAFARAWVESRDRARPRGETALRRELSLKGLDRETIEAALEARRRGERLGRLGEALGGSTPRDATDADAASADEAAAWRLLERRASTLRRERDPRTRRQKAYALLARNGFDPGTCREVATAWVAADSGAEAEVVDD
jgi:SOS response regulatory protein OraA/RecX